MAKSDYVRDLEKQLKKVTQSLAKLGKATDATTKAEVRSLRQEETSLQSEIRHEQVREMGRNVARGAASAVLAGMSDPFMTQNELTRVTGRKIGEAIGGAEGLTFSIGPEAGGIIGEMGGQGFVDLLDKAKKAGVDVPTTGDYTKFMSSAQFNRFIEQNTLGTFQQVFGPQMMAGEMSDEAMKPALGALKTYFSKLASGMRRATDLYSTLPGLRKNTSGRE